MLYTGVETLEGETIERVEVRDLDERNYLDQRGVVLDRA